MVSGTKSTKNSDIWCTIYPTKFIDIFKGKQQANIQNLLGSVAVLGDSQTSDMAKYVLSYGKTKGFVSELRYRDYYPLQNNYSRILSDNSVQTHGGKKILDELTGEPKKNPNPVKLGYAVITGKPESTKGIPTPKYFLTLKGFLLVIGFSLNTSELRLVINNASKISLFFCFIKNVLDNESVQFVTDIFIKPIQKVLLRSDIFQNGDIDFYFSNFADAISLSLSEKMKMIYEKRKNNINNKSDSYFSEKITSEYMKLHSTLKFSDLIERKKRDELYDLTDVIFKFRTAGIESVMDNVFYSNQTRNDWYESLIDYFYPTNESKSFFLKFGTESEKHLMYKLMQSLYFSYTFFNYGLLPYKEKKLPRSKEWKRNQKYKKPDKEFFKKYGSKFKTMKEYDISNLD